MFTKNSRDCSLTLAAGQTNLKITGLSFRFYFDRFYDCIRFFSSIQRFVVKYDTSSERI